MSIDWAIDDQDAILTHVALYWCTDIGAWQLLCLGRSPLEIEEKVSRWKSKGTDHIRVYELRPPATEQTLTGAKE